jgi:DNA polymerase III epsilon subunit-like protein
MPSQYPPLRQRPFAWCDTETTGLNPDQNDILDIAIVRVMPDGTEEVFEAKVQMDRPENAHPKALEVNGYTPEKWAGARTAAEVFGEIHERGLLRDCILAGQNVGFDAAFINATFKRLGIKARVDYHLFDTVTLALEHLLPYLENSVSLVPVCVALGIPTEGAHGAMADCRMAMAVHRVLTTATPADKERWATEIPARLAAWQKPS